MTAPFKGALLGKKSINTPSNFYSSLRRVGHKGLTTGNSKNTDGSGLSFYHIRGKTLFSEGTSRVFRRVCHRYPLLRKEKNSRKCPPHSLVTLIKGGKPYYLRRSTDSSAEAREKEPEEATSGTDGLYFGVAIRSAPTTRSKPHAERKVEGDSTDCIIRAVVARRSISG